VTNGLSGDGAGIHVVAGNNRIEDNNVTGNDRGIDVSAAGNLILKNSARNNGTSSAGNYAIVADNRYGPIIDDTATGSIAASGKGPFTSTLVSTDPWANFSY
jgi:parallel beta-helix repeat protein